LPAQVARSFATFPLRQLPNEKKTRKVKVPYTRGSLDSIASGLDQQLVLLPHDAVPVPTFPHKASAVISLREDEVVDSSNREVRTGEKEPVDHDPKSAAKWIIEKLRQGTK
jgi:hypothetical protein